MDQNGGMIDQFSVYMNRLALYNREHLNLKKYETKDSLKPIDMSFINSIIAQRQNCSYNFMTLMKFMYEHTVCINANYIIDKLNKNLEEIYRKFNNRTHILHISNIYSRDKSNFFFILYFILHYNLKFKKPIYVYSKEFNKRYIDSVYKDKPVLFIICDDFSYSGTQIHIEVVKLKNEHIAIKYEGAYKDYLIYINVFGYTINAFNKINQTKIKYLYLPEHIKPYNNSVREIFTTFIKYNKIDVNNFIKKYDVFIVGTDNKIKSLLYNILFYERIANEVKLLDTYLIYLYYKFPDFLSTYLNLCKLPIFDDSVYVLNDKGKEFIKIDNLDIYTRLQFYNFNIATNEQYKIKCDKNIFYNRIKLIKGKYLLKGIKKDSTFIKYQIGQKIINSDIIDNESDEVIDYCNKILIPFYKTNIYNQEIPLSLLKNIKYTFEDLYRQHIPYLQHSHA